MSIAGQQDVTRWRSAAGRWLPARCKKAMRRWIPGLSVDDRSPLPYVGLHDEIPLSPREFARAGEIQAWNRALVQARDGYVQDAGLDAETARPGGIWSRETNGGLYEGYRLVAQHEYSIINRLRLFSQQFTGWRLASQELAMDQPFPAPAEIDLLAAPQSPRVPDVWVGRYRRLCRRLPSRMHLGAPARLGEVGWLVRGQIVNHDTCVYLERLAMLYECKILSRLERLRDTRGLPRLPRILEIGGGYGGLAYFLKRLIPAAHYVLVDLPESLLYSAIYLSMLLPDDAHDLHLPGSAPVDACRKPGFQYFANYLFDELVRSEDQFDLVINTLSMSEMSPAQVRQYCQGIRTVLAPGGMFFEQNQDNRAIGHLSVAEIIGEYFRGCQHVASRIVPSPADGEAHLWWSA